MLRVKTACLMAFACCSLLVVDLWAAPLVPAGLNDGDQYQLIFVTADPSGATDFDISAYDAFVQAQAAENSALTGTDVGVVYNVVGSTYGLNARDHALIEAPVYNLFGQLIATGFADMWDNDTVSNFFDFYVQYDQFGHEIQQGNVWTGTLADGTASATDFLGAPTPVFGQLERRDSKWVEAGNITTNTEPYRLYGLSQVLTYNAVPEPSSLALCLLGALGLLAVRRR